MRDDDIMLPFYNVLCYKVKSNVLLITISEIHVKSLKASYCFDKDPHNMQV